MTDRSIGIVVIGRNEGERLRRCLRSVRTTGAAVVYVDSGSNDGSVACARDSGAMLVELDATARFTAARARNAGFERLLAERPDVEYVQFIDGDCELDPGWLAIASAALESDSTLAVVCGRRREAFPGSSIYNHLCDIEWETPIGEAMACGGDALMRVRAFREAEGFRPDLIAGEEAELCARLRRRGFRVRRLAAEMTRHDAALTRFSQWWARCVRSGHAYAQGASLHRNTRERYWTREWASILVWGIAGPCLAISLAGATHGRSLVLLIAYPALVLRIWRTHRARLGSRSAFVFAVFCVLAKVPQALGAVRFALAAVAGPSGLIEYKRSSRSVGESVR